MNTPHVQSQRTPILLRGVLLFLALIAIDHVIKLFVVTRDISHICNEGIAFGLTLPPLVFSVLWLILVILFLHFWFKNTLESFRATLPFVLIVSGGVSNLLDRFVYGCVIDYIPFLNISLFNFADFLISCGALLLIVHGREQKN